MPDHNKKSHRPGTNLFGKGQRVITDKYREGYDNIKWEREEQPSKNSQTDSE